MSNDFSFAPISDKELAEQKKLREIQEAVKATLQAAKDCLNSDMFRKYKEEYLRQERLIIDNFITLSIADPVEYACVCRTIAAKLAVIRDLILMVEGDAGKKI